MRHHHDREQGVVSLEMALSMPILILVFFGVFVFTHAFYLRFVMTARVHDVARVCAIRKLEMGACQAHANEQFASLGRFCDGLLVEARVEAIAGVDNVRGVELTVTCPYQVVGLSLFNASGNAPQRLSARSLVPY